MSDDSTPYSVRCLFQTGTSVACSVGADARVGDLIDRLEASPGVTVPDGCRTALIYRGKFLDRSERLSSVEPMREFSVQVFFRAAKQPQAQQSEEPRELRGFDRLTRMNFTAEQIRQIRANFHQMNGSAGQSAEERLDLEEEWFPVIFNQENPIDILNANLGTAGAEGINNQEEELENGDTFDTLPSWIHLLIGFGLGSVFGFVAIIVVFAGMRHRFMLIGMVLGILMHYTLSSNGSIL